MPTTTEPLRLAIIASHPIQHFVPLYRTLARQDDVNLLLLYASTAGQRPYFDKEMNTAIVWAGDMTRGYSNKFLKNSDKTPTSGFFAVYSPDLWTELKTFAPDAIVVYGYSQLNSIIALLWGKIHKVPIAMISDSSSKYMAMGWRSKAKHRVLRALAPLYDCLFTVGDSNEEYWRLHGAKDGQLVRLPFSIDEEAFESALRNSDSINKRIRHELQVEDGKLLALTVGKLSARKRPMDLLHALVGDEVLCRKVHVVFAGDGELRAELQAFIGTHRLPASLVGFLNTDRLPDYYVAADLYVHCANRDPHPLTLTEAACCGLPLVVADLVGAVGPTDVAQVGVNALVYETENSEDLRVRLREIVDDNLKRNKMEASSRRIYETMTLNKLAQIMVTKMRSLSQRSAQG